MNDAGDINHLISEARKYKQVPRLHANLGNGKRMGLIFMNPSLRTRVSTQIAAEHLGMKAIVLNVSQDGWALEFMDGAIMNGNTVEHIKDAAGVLGNYFDLLGLRTFPTLHSADEDSRDAVMQAFRKYSGIPVVSLESATLHPLQSLADMITIAENKKEESPKIVLTWAPHVKALPQCVANSFAQWVNAWAPDNFVIACPPGYELNPEYSGRAAVVYDRREALENADFVYVKSWSSFSQYGMLPPVKGDWMLTNESLKVTNKAQVMHCLPVRRNVELSDEILDGPDSLVQEQAANRVWSAQAVLAEMLNSQ